MWLRAMNKSCMRQNFHLLACNIIQTHAHKVAKVKHETRIVSNEISVESGKLGATIELLQHLDFDSRNVITQLKRSWCCWNGAKLLCIRAKQGVTRTRFAHEIPKIMLSCLINQLSLSSLSIHHYFMYGFFACKPPAWLSYSILAVWNSFMHLNPHTGFRKWSDACERWILLQILCCTSNVQQWPGMAKHFQNNTGLIIQFYSVGREGFTIQIESLFCTVRVSVT